MAKPPAKKAASGSKALTAAKAKVAKLEGAAKKKAAVTSATAGVKKAQAALAAAKKLKG